MAIKSAFSILISARSILHQTTFASKQPNKVCKRFVWKKRVTLPIDSKHSLQMCVADTVFRSPKSSFRLSGSQQNHPYILPYSTFPFTIFISLDFKEHFISLMTMVWFISLCHQQFEINKPFSWGQQFSLTDHNCNKTLTSSNESFLGWCVRTKRQC